MRQAPPPFLFIFLRFRLGCQLCALLPADPAVRWGHLVCFFEDLGKVVHIIDANFFRNGCNGKVGLGSASSPLHPAWESMQHERHPTSLREQVGQVALADK